MKEKDNDMTAECSICCEKFNATTRKEVVCGFCPQTCCRQCYKTYLSGSVNGPHCMSCKVPWNMDKMWADFPKAFIDKDLRQHMEKIIYDREKARLPETQQMIFVENQRRLYHALLNTRNVCLELGFSGEQAKVDAMIREIEERVGPEALRENHRAAAVPQVSIRTSSNFQAVRPCPKDECRGFIQKATHSCGLCGTKVCERCHMTVNGGDEHTCNKDDVESVKLMKKDCKACPSCAAICQKVDGCDQVWCMVCHKAFSWRTGEFESNVHAADYYAYMRRMKQTIPRNPADGVGLGAAAPPAANPCNPQALLNWAFVQRWLGSVVDKEMLKEVALIHRAVMHNQELRHNNADLNARFEAPNFHLNLRRSYLLNSISEDEWKRQLILNERKKERKEALQNVYNLFQQVATELLNGMARAPASTAQNMEELVKLREYCNEQFANVASRYKVNPYVINERWFLLRERKAKPVAAE